MARHIAREGIDTEKTISLMMKPTFVDSRTLATYCDAGCDDTNN